MTGQRGIVVPDLSETKAEAKKDESPLCRDVKYFLENRSPAAFKAYCENLLTQYEKGLISREYLREFLLGSYQDGFNGLQWLLSQKSSHKARIILWMLGKLQELQLYTAQEVLSQLTVVNGFGRSAYDYALLGSSVPIYFSVANLLYQAVKDGYLPVEQFNQILSHKDARGRPLLAKVLQLCSSRVATFYFYQWQQSASSDPAALHRFADTLVAPYSLQVHFRVVLPSSRGRVLLQEVLESGDLQKLDLYVKQLSFCFDKGALSEGRYFQALTAVKAPGFNTLQIIQEKHPEFLEAYLKQLLACAEKQIAPIPDLLALFKPLALPLPSSVFPRDVPRRMQFVDKRLSVCVDNLMERLQAGTLDLVETLPGLRWFNKRMAFATAKQQKVEQAKMEYKRS